MEVPQRDRFTPTFIIQGQIYHRIGGLAETDESSKYLQIYFIGNEEDELNRRCVINEALKRPIILKLQKMLHETNPLIKEFKIALQNLGHRNKANYNIIINADRVPRGEHEQRFNRPTTDEVAVIISGNEGGSRDIVIRKNDNRLMKVHDTNRFYDALQYPLILWDAKEGYCFNIPMVNPSTRLEIPGKTVSCKDFYAYHLMVRRNNFNSLLKSKKLFHQFAVDMYVKMENERLTYIRTHQNELRANDYIHLKDALEHDGNIDPNDLGKIKILPGSLINSPRYLAQLTQDAFSYVRLMGKPDLFITFTCNPQWKEITEQLFEKQNSTDRHDIIARVFFIKVKQLINV